MRTLKYTVPFLFLLCCFFSLPSFSQNLHATETYNIGVAWQGKSGMSERVLRGVKRTLAHHSAEWQLDIQKELATRNDLEAVVSQFEADKDAMIIMRSSGTRMLSQREISIPAFVGATHNPVILGAAQSLDTPQKNLAGVTYYIPARLKLKVLQEIFPGAEEYVLLVEDGHPGSAIDHSETHSAALELGLRGKTVFCTDVQDVLSEIAHAPSEAVVILGAQHLLMDNARHILDAAGHRPVYSYTELPVEAGALAGVVADDIRLGQILGKQLIDAVTGKRSISDIPIRTDPSPRLQLNHQAVQRFSDKIPFSIKSLSATEQLLENIVSGAPTGIGVVKDRVITDVNEYILELTGYSQTDLIGESIRILYPTQEEFERIQNTAYAKTGSAAPPVEALWQRKTGEIRHVQISLAPLSSGTSSPAYTFTVLDITQRKNAEAALARRTRWFIFGLSLGILLLCVLIIRLFYSLRKEKRAVSALHKSEEKIAATLNSIGDGVIATDTQGLVVTMNPVAEDLCGWTLSKARGKPLRDVFSIINAQNREEVQNPVQKVLTTGHIVGLANHTILISQSGAEYHIADSAAPIRDSRSIITGVVLVFSNITEKYSLQEQLRQSRKMDAIGQLAGGVAHDFNNSLSSILGAVELLRLTDPSTEEQNEYIDLIISAAERAGDLTQKLLTYSRKGSTEKASIDCARITRDTVSLLRYTLDKSIEVSLQSTAEQTVIWGDESLLQTALMNMGINASHAMPTGGILTFTLENCDLSADYCSASPFDISPGSYLHISVRDTGTGIAPEKLPHIFEPFFTTKKQGKGTGLGLSAVYGTIREHDGAVTVSSEPGAGTEFHLYLPLTAQVESAPAAQEESTGGTETILLIDDEKLIRITAKKQLESLGYTVICADDGVAGVDLFTEKTDDIDLVILDMIMPRMGGRETFTALREISPHIPVIIASGFSKDEDITALREQGISGFIHKPFRRNALGKMVYSALHS
jgi:PAS domain S-box-containing protein